MRLQPFSELAKYIIIVIYLHNGVFLTILKLTIADNIKTNVSLPSTMYWTDWGSKPKIEQAAMDGSSRRSVITGNLGWPNGLTIDRSTNLLYWADAKLDKIEVSDLTGANRRLVVASAADIHPFGLTLYQDMLYWTTGIARVFHVWI